MKIFKPAVLAAAAAAALGCSVASNTNTVNTNQNTTSASANDAQAVAPAPLETAATFSLATPSDAYRTAYALRGKKDIAGMKRVLSKDVIEFLEMVGESEKKTLDEEIAQMFDRPQAKTAETRNEKIKGNHATIEYLDEEGNWDTMDFVKEGQDWKLTIPGKDSPSDKPANK